MLGKIQRSELNLCDTKIPETILLLLKQKYWSCATCSIIQDFYFFFLSMQSSGNILNLNLKICLKTKGYALRYKSKKTNRTNTGFGFVVLSVIIFCLFCFLNLLVYGFCQVFMVKSSDITKKIL